MCNTFAAVLQLSQQRALWGFIRASVQLLTEYHIIFYTFKHKHIQLKQHKDIEENPSKQQQHVYIGALICCFILPSKVYVVKCILWWFSQHGCAHSLENSLKCGHFILFRIVETKIGHAPLKQR